RAREQPVRRLKRREFALHRIRPHALRDLRGKHDLLARLLRKFPQRHIRALARQVETSAPRLRGQDAARRSETGNKPERQATAGRRGKAWEGHMPKRRASPDERHIPIGEKFSRAASRLCPSRAPRKSPRHASAPLRATPSPNPTPTPMSPPPS